MVKVNKKRTAKRENRRSKEGGKLRIGDNWNAITIIALSQSNPLKSVAELVENSIDARAKNVTILRGKEHGDNYLKIVDDGEGICRDEKGIPNFKYVATHICDSIKKEIKKSGVTGIQGEFGIGLLSFWTFGEELKLVSSGADGKTYQMKMVKDNPDYVVSHRRTLLSVKGTEVTVSPLLHGVRHINGEKMQRYLASELRDRIRQSGVKIKIIDRTARKEFMVKPREFQGRLLHQLPAPAINSGEIYAELYLNETSKENQVGLYRSGTRVLHSITELDRFQKDPWTSGWLEGLVDVPFLNLTPGTRSGIIHDENFFNFSRAIMAVEEKLIEIIAEQRKAEEERASRQILRTVQKALKEAILSLPKEEYDWFEIHGEGRDRRKNSDAQSQADADSLDNESTNPLTSENREQKQFFEFPGPLYSARISPSSSVVPVGTSKNFRAICRDRNKRPVEGNLSFCWEIAEGKGRLENPENEIVTFAASDEPGLIRMILTVTQENLSCSAEGLVTVTEFLLPKSYDQGVEKKGLPGYTFRRASGELWRSMYDETQNIIVVNNGHRDFVYSSKNKARKLRYICRLFAKELVYRNFPGIPSDQLLERMIELTLYTEDYLK